MKIETESVSQKYGNLPVLQDISFTADAGEVVALLGPNGSGKSTLIDETLKRALMREFYGAKEVPGKYKKLTGMEHFDKVIEIDQSPIGRTPRSNPATYVGFFSEIRELFAATESAKIRGYLPGRFSFNMKGGRCEVCGGDGVQKLEMSFLPDVYVPCEKCGGQRYNPETLSVRFKGKTIFDILDMTVNQAVDFFDSQPHILRKIKTLQDVGLGYIKLGQASTTLSGGESQRIKLATELSRPTSGRTLYILDEPTTGLHFEDIHVLMSVLRKLVDKGNTVLIIEHNLDVIRATDYIIDMGPEAGRNGGQVVATGTQEDIRRSPASITGKYL